MGEGGGGQYGSRITKWAWKLFWLFLFRSSLTPPPPLVSCRQGGWGLRQVRGCARNPGPRLCGGGGNCLFHYLSQPFWEITSADPIQKVVGKNFESAVTKSDKGGLGNDLVLSYPFHALRLIGYNLPYSAQTPSWRSTPPGAVTARPSPPSGRFSPRRWRSTPASVLLMLTPLVRGGGGHSNYHCIDTVIRWEIKQGCFRVKSYWW